MEPPAARLWVSVWSVQLSVAGSCRGEDEGLRAALFRLEGNDPAQGGRPWVCLGWSVGEEEKGNRGRFIVLDLKMRGNEGRRGERGRKMGTTVERETTMGKRALRFSMVLVPGEGKGGGCFLL